MMVVGVRRAVAAAAPVVFVLLWSTGFIGAKYGLPYAPPLTFLALRLGVAGVLLAGAAAVTGSARLSSRAQFGRAGVVGLLLHAGTSGACSTLLRMDCRRVWPRWWSVCNRC